MSSARQATVRRPMSVGLTVVAALLLVGGAVILLLPRSYSATGVVALVPRPQADVSAETITLVSGAYVAYLASPEIASRAAQVSGADASAVASGTEVAVDPGTTNVRVRVTLPSAKSAADTANAMLDLAARKAATDPLLNADPVSPALDEAAEANPPRALLFMITLLASVIAGGAVAFVLAQRNRRG